MIRTPHPDHHPSVNAETIGALLHRCFEALYQRFPYDDDSAFEVSLTANAVLRHPVTGRVGLFYGQDFGAETRALGQGPFVIHGLDDVARLPRDIPAHLFEQLFRRAFEDSEAVVESLVNLIYIARRYLPDFERDRRGEGRPGRFLRL